MEVKNLFYFNTISHIGGIETWLWEIAKKYGSTHSIAVVYSQADKEQIARLKPFVRTIQHKDGMKYKCDRAFFCFNMDIIDCVEAKEKTLVIHGNYKWLQDAPPINKGINKVIAVSKDSADAYTELTGVPCEVAYNPLTVDKPKRMIHILSATRLNNEGRGTNIKGAGRMFALADALDKYCETHKVTYRWDIFCNIEGQESEHIFYHKGRLDIRDYLADADFVCQLSDNFEGYNYTVNEALTLGTPVIVTPCDVYKELGINDKMAVFVDFDLSNLDKAVKKIFTTKKWEFTYKTPEDRWGELLSEGEPDYKYDPNAIVKVRALKGFTDIVDTEVGRPRELGEEFEVTQKRFEVLEDFGGLVELV